MRPSVPPRDWTFRVQDILDAIGAIRGYTAGMSFEGFTRDRRTVDAAVRNLIIIGEAAARIPEEVSGKATDLPWADMRAMRNFVVHGYFGVSDSILWDTIQQDLPGVVDPLRRLLESESA